MDIFFVTEEYDFDKNDECVFQIRVHEGCRLCES